MVAQPDRTIEKPLMSMARVAKTNRFSPFIGLKLSFPIDYVQF